MVFGQNSVQAVNLGICDCLQSSAWAELKERACGAFGSAGDAGLASVVNQAMREINPFGFSDNLHEVAFNDLRILRCCQTEEVCDPAHVCVDHDARWDSEPSSQDHACRFSTDARQGNQLLDVLGDFAIETINQSLSHASNICGLISEKAQRSHDPFNVSLGTGGQSCGIGIFDEQLRRRLVNAFVRTLRRKNCRYE